MTSAALLPRTVSNTACASMRWATAVLDCTTVRASTSGPTTSVEASTRRPAVSPDQAVDVEQVDLLAQQRDPVAGHVPAQRGGTGVRVAGAAEDDEFTPLESGVCGHVDLDRDVDVRTLADQERARIGQQLRARPECDAEARAGRCAGAALGDAGAGRAQLGPGARVHR